MYNEIINYGFKKFVNDNFKKEEIRNFLLKHERLHIMIENLTRELKGAEKFLLNNRVPQEDKRRFIKELINDFSRMFCKVAIDELSIRRGLQEYTPKRGGNSEEL